MPLQKQSVNLLAGCYIDNGDARVARPLNMIPVAKSTGISDSYFRTLDGIEEINFQVVGTPLAANERGAYFFRGKQVRIFGRVGYTVDLESKTITEAFNFDEPLGGAPGEPIVQFAESFDWLAMTASGYLYLWNGTDEFVKVDTSAVVAGYIIDVVFVGGFFIFTDGEFIYSTDILNPKVTIVGSYDASEFDTDAVTGLVNLRNIVYAANRYSIQEYVLSGTGIGFPMQTNSQTLIQRGAINPQAFIKFNQDLLVFVGGGRGEQISVFSAINGQTSKISTHDEDTILNSLNELELKEVRLESQVIDDNIFLLIHVPKRPTMVFDSLASQLLKTPAWHYRSSSTNGKGDYVARSILYVENSGWYVSHLNEGKLGKLNRNISKHFGKDVLWTLTSPISYAGQSHFQIFQHELIPLTIDFDTEAKVYRDYSTNGKDWSPADEIQLSKTVFNRLVILNPIFAPNWIITRWYGYSTSNLRMSISNAVYNYQVLAF